MTRHSPNSPDEIVDNALRQIGAPQGRVVLLSLDDGITASNFEYADLLKVGPHGQRVSAVIEKDGSPLVYLANIPTNSPDIGRGLAQMLGNRGETSILLDVYLADDNHKLLARAWPCMLNAERAHPIDLTNPVDARSVLGDLQEGLWGTTENTYQEQRLRELLVASVEKVSASLKIPNKVSKPSDAHNQEVLALVGRALFTRFLLDRCILTKDTASSLWEILGNDGSTAFDSVERATATCEWLDMTFNGEFMPLPTNGDYRGYFTNLFLQSKTALAPLGWIVNRTDSGGQLPLWEKLDFSHIPAGTLSEVYENYARQAEPQKAKKQSVHFTPRHIARMMVRQALAGVPNKRVADSKVLDPAVGAAVFLSLTYRELARHRAIQANGVWPDTKQLRDILYHQLRGMDVNSSALNLAALTLYLTAIELDANPAPPEKLKFDEPLIGTVLRDVGEKNPDCPHAHVLGSLRTDMEFEKDFDVVIGNPPWTSVQRTQVPEDDSSAEPAGASDEFAREAEIVANACISRKGVSLPSRYAHPDKVPDIAFFWKSTEWVKEGGIIALIVSQRLLIKRTPVWALARRALFSCVEINGIIDAGEFANHDKLIWPGVESPFCILFARNQKPEEMHRILMITLAVEPTLSRRRQIRIDPLATMSIAMSEFDERPGGLVVRTRGSELDRALLRRWWDRMTIQNEQKQVKSKSSRHLPLTTIESCIRKFSALDPKRGFKTGKKNTKIPEWIQSLPPGSKELPAEPKDRITGEICASELKIIFEPRPFRSSPTSEWYKPPFLLIRQKGGELGELARTIIVTPAEDGIPVLYPFAYVGIPLRAEKEAMLYAKYVSLWINSSLYSYYQTLTSTQFSYGIKVLLNEEILGTPIMDMQVAMRAGLTNTEEIEKLFSRLTNLTGFVQSDIDAWICQIMELDEHEQELIEDTLSVSYPIGKSRQSGKTWVSEARLTQYVENLKAELSSDSDLIDNGSIKRITTSSTLSGWQFLTWKATCPLSPDVKAGTILDGYEEANLLYLVREKYPEGEVWAITKDEQFIFGQLALNRLWLPSRASLAAQVMVSWVDKSVA